MKGQEKSLKLSLTLNKNTFSLMTETTKKIDLKLFKTMVQDSRWISLEANPDSNQDNQACHSNNSKCEVEIKEATSLSKSFVKGLMTTSQSS